MTQNILFVDDEPNMLASLRRMLHGMRGQWNMSFAQGGEEALAIVARTPQDVIVTDMRMPGMDGGQLLARVQEISPATVRIILSGHSDMGMVLKAVKPAHQYLSKPCGAEELKEAVVRALALGTVLTDESVKRIISRIDTLPAVPALFVKLVEELNREDPSPRRIGDLISEDVGMSAGILKVVNSSFFGLRTHVSSPHQAVNLLGTDTIKALVLSVHLFSRHESESGLAFSFPGLWRHSAVTAALAKAIAETDSRDPRMADHCYIAGLLHDVGKLVLACHFTDGYARVLGRVRSENRPVHEVEKEDLEVTHAEVGAYLLGLWGLPSVVVEAVFHHHAPARHSDVGFTPLAAVHVANSLEHELVVLGKGYALHPLDQDYLAAQGLDGRLPLWREACERRLQEIQPHGA